MGNGGVFSLEDLGLILVVVGQVTNPNEHEGLDFGVWVQLTSQLHINSVVLRATLLAEDASFQVKE